MKTHTQETEIITLSTGEALLGNTPLGSLTDGQRAALQEEMHEANYGTGLPTPKLSSYEPHWTIGSILAAMRGDWSND